MKLSCKRMALVATGLALCLLSLTARPARAWNPTKPITIVIPYARGGADVIGRFIQSVVGKYHLCEQPLVVINKEGGSGSVGMKYLIDQRGDGHYLMVSLSSAITTPLMADLGFSWRDCTPVCRLALDRHALCLSTKTHPDIHSLDQFITLAKQMSARGTPLKVGGTGINQEDEIVTLMLEKAAGIELEYIPVTNGQKVARDVAAGLLDASVNNPSEFLGYVLCGDMRLLAAFDRRRVMGYINVPTMPELGYPEATYRMLRGIFMPPEIDPGAVQYMTELVKKVIETQDWRDFQGEIMLDGSEPVFGEKFRKWLEEYEALHVKYLKGGDLKKD